MRRRRGSNEISGFIWTRFWISRAVIAISADLAAREAAARGCWREACARGALLWRVCGAAAAGRGRARCVVHFCIMHYYRVVWGAKEGVHVSALKEFW